MQILTKNSCKTVYGQNLSKISTQCNSNVEKIDNFAVKKNMKYFPLPENESWRIPLLCELLSLKAQTSNLPGFSLDKIDDMLLYACTS